jgi:hypothetical protein
MSPFTDHDVKQLFVFLFFVFFCVLVFTVALFNVGESDFALPARLMANAERM